MIARLLLLGALLGTPLVGESPSDKCSTCHADIAKRYRSSPMARTSGTTGGSKLEKFDKAAFSSPRGLASYRVSDRFVLGFNSAAAEGTRTLDYFLGAGQTGRSYITSIDGFLYQAPAAWYSARGAWDLSPGYENTEAVNLVREIEPGCLQCHASGLKAIAGTTNGFQQPPWSEDGVTCIRCHGEGDKHPSPNGHIFNAAKSGGDIRAGTCAQCHLPGAVEIAKPGRTKTQFAAGMKLADYVTTFVFEGADQETTVNGHFEQLSRSACARASGDALWCGTCHKIHSDANPRAACLTCHETKPCTASQQIRSARGDDCIACHMPKRQAATVQHAATTDHTIRKRPVLNASSMPTDLSLTAFGGANSTDRDLGLAYASVGLRDNNRAWGTRAVALLEKASLTASDDPKVTSALAQLYDRMGRTEAACKLFARTVEQDPLAVAAKVNLGTCYASKGDLEQAMAAWTEVLRANPGMESARLNLAVAQYKAGRIADAKSTLHEALRFNPASLRAKELLAGMP